MKRRKNAKEDTVCSLKRPLNPFNGIQSSLSFRDVVSTHHSQDKAHYTHFTFNLRAKWCISRPPSLKGQAYPKGLPRSPLTYFLTIEYTVRILTSTLRNYVPLSSVEEFAENGENAEASTDLHSEDKNRKDRENRRKSRRRRKESQPLHIGGFLTPSYCRNYNIIDSIIIIDCSSSWPSRRILRE